MAKSTNDLTAGFASMMARRRPKKEGATFDIMLSSSGEVQGDVRYVLLTGNDSFDRIVGGFPFGRISEVFGLENCGKSALMIRSMCRFKSCDIYEVVSKEGFIYTVKKVSPSKIQIIRAYVDNEHSLETGFKMTITDTTFDAEGNEVVERKDMEGTATIMCDTVDDIFKNLDGFIEKIKEAEKINAEDENGKIVFGLFIVDTIAGTSSKEEIERPWGERDYPRQAQQISLGFRRMTNQVSRHNVAMICTNQVRTKFKDLQQGGGYKARFNTPQVDDFSTFGGKALSFYSTHRVFMFQIPVKYTLVKGALFPAGYLIGFRTHKNRLRKPGREGRMVLLFDEDQGGIHNILSMLESMIFLRVAKYQDNGIISFLFRKHKIETTTFAENVVLDEDGDRKRKKDPYIEARHEWLSFYKAHRTDLDKLWEVAMRRAYETEGLGAFYEPDDEDEDSDSGGGEDNDPAPRRRVRGAPISKLSDEDL